MAFNNTTDVQDFNISQPNVVSKLEFVQEPSWFAIIRLTVESIIALAGIIGNLAVCFAISKHRTLNTAPTNTYIRNVAIGDLATLFVSFPLGVVREQFTYWPIGEFLCYVFPASDTFFGVSVWSIATIAVERHRMVTADVPRLALRSLRTPRIVCAAIWIFSFLGISLPLLLVYEYKDPPNSTEPKCEAEWPFKELPYIYSITMTLVTYVIPLSLILGTYCAITRKVNKSESFHLEIAESSFSGSFRTGQMSLVKSRSRRVSKIMTPVVVVFAITILPLSILRVIPVSFYGENPNFHKYSFILFKICIFFYLFNSACNPLIYSLVSRRFRQSFRELLSWN